MGGEGTMERLNLHFRSPSLPLLLLLLQHVLCCCLLLANGQLLVPPQPSFLFPFPLARPPSRSFPILSHLHAHPQSHPFCHSRAHGDVTSGAAPGLHSCFLHCASASARPSSPGRFS